MATSNRRTTVNLVQLKLLKAMGYEYKGAELATTAIGKPQYVAVAIKNGMPASAGGTTIRQAEDRLVMCVTRPGDAPWKEEERFLAKMRKRYAK